MTFELFLKFVGQRIASVRRSRELTQFDAAKQVGISYRYFQNIETGVANITLSTLFRIANQFGVHASEFFPQKNGNN